MILFQVKTLYVFIIVPVFSIENQTSCELLYKCICTFQGGTQCDKPFDAVPVNLLLSIPNCRLAIYSLNYLLVTSFKFPWISQISLHSSLRSCKWCEIADYSFFFSHSLHFQEPWTRRIPPIRSCRSSRQNIVSTETLPVHFSPGNAPASAPSRTRPRQLRAGGLQGAS